MTDDDLIHQLRNSKGWPTLGNAAADRIEALIAERDRAAQEARAVALEEAAEHHFRHARGYNKICQDQDAAVHTAHAKAILALLDTPAAEALHERVRAEEREACFAAAKGVADARIAEIKVDHEQVDDPYGDGLLDKAVGLSAEMLAAIRARGETRDLITCSTLDGDWVDAKTYGYLPRKVSEGET